MITTMHHNGEAYTSLQMRIKMNNISSSSVSAGAKSFSSPSKSLNVNIPCKKSLMAKQAKYVHSKWNNKNANGTK